VLAERGCTYSDIAPLIHSGAATNSQPNEAHESRVIRQPIIRSGDQFVVVAPGNLLNAARHAVVSRAVTDGFATALATNFRNSVYLSVVESLERVGMQHRGGTPPEHLGEILEGIF